VRNTPPPPRSVLLSVIEPGEFVELKRIAALLFARGDGVSFFFPRADYFTYERDVRICRQNGWSWIDHRGRVFEPSADLEGYIPASVRELRGLNRPSPLLVLAVAVFALLFLLPMTAVKVLVWVLRLPFNWARSRKLRAAALSEALLLIKGIVSCSRQLRLSRRILRLVQPQAVLVGQDYAGSPNAFLIREAVRARIPTGIAPFAIGTTREISESLAGRSLHQAGASPMNRFLAWAFPRWVHEFRGRRLLRLPGTAALPLELYRIAPAHPWVPNSSEADSLAVESPAMLAYYRRMRFPENKLRLTGSATDDILHSALTTRDELRAELERELGLRAGLPLLLCAWPPDQFGGRQEGDFSSYATLCDFWARSLSAAAKAHKWNLIVRPHPVLRVGDIPAFQRFNLPVTRRDTASLVPLSDLFVASVSSTIRWAVAAGIPVVNFDVYQYGYIDFAEEDGVLTSDDSFRFLRDLRLLMGDRASYDGVVRRQSARRQHWGMVDGNSGARLVAWIDSLA
jgi:hypothetical protein